MTATASAATSASELTEPTNGSSKPGLVDRDTVLSSVASAFDADDGPFWAIGSTSAKTMMAATAAINFVMPQPSTPAFAGRLRCDR